jgi:ribosomal protein L11 methyltransferase|uniref:Methyltransferase domain-containing protein n=1 Tax=Desulfobacca acetoxidans TaxID=60893 RepID=A0A7C3SKK3_9BACT
MPPPEKLFIYEIAGRLHPPPPLTGQDFLGCWQEGGYTYLFYSTPQKAQVQAWLALCPEQGHYSSETVLNYADWEAGCHLRPARVAGFYLCPVWEAPEPEPGDLLIRLDPGLAFGSGAHPTTRLCLRLLRRVWGRDRPLRVLDLGAGTGVLSLAALALGARQAVAVEYNDLAARTASRNIRYNQREKDIFLIQGDARHFAHLPADLALANIHLDVLLDLLAIPEFLNKKSYIFSGILGTQMPRFRAALTAASLRILETLDENLWFAVLATNPRGR